MQQQTPGPPAASGLAGGGITIPPNDPGAQWALSYAQQFARPYAHLPPEQYNYYLKYYFDYYYSYYQRYQQQIVAAQQHQQASGTGAPHSQPQFQPPRANAGAMPPPQAGQVPPNRVASPAPAAGRPPPQRGTQTAAASSSGASELLQAQRAAGHANYEKNVRQPGDTRERYLRPGPPQRSGTVSSISHRQKGNIQPPSDTGTSTDSRQNVPKQSEQAQASNGTHDFRKRALDAASGVSEKLKARKIQKEQNNGKASDVHQPAEQTSSNLQQRAKRFKKEHQMIKEQRSDPLPSSIGEQAKQGGVLFGGGCNNELGDLDWDSLTIQGTSNKLEKRYLRLTAPPDPADVRPEPVLKKALKWVMKQVEEGASYVFLNDQLKSIRQDLVVQRIRNAFTVNAYETHARVALENGDINEFNQCQTQLITLYDEVSAGHPREFLAYRILYCCYSRNNTNLLDIMKQLTEDQRKDSLILHALEVCHAVTQNNYHRFFRLFSEAERMSPYLMDHIAWRMQLRGFMAMSRAYRDKPGLSLQFTASELGFTSPEECKRHLEHAGGMTLPASEGSEEKWVFDTKSSSSNLKFVKSLAFLEANPVV
eukprot:gb/GECG01014409.1/.p1 GENE.gb/GECG01014409.1/~~gb/GECG01014409.1/.p1  ORF type:complete len:594 (+),score=82.44 gb/GECG01014409.1/:1-1782(+)